LRKWLNGMELRRTTKRQYANCVRSLMSYHNRPLPKPHSYWTKKLTDDREQARVRITPDILPKLAAVLGTDLRREGMFLVQLQSFSGPRELCVVGNKMGVEVGQAVRNGANLVELNFTKPRKMGEHTWRSFIGKDACDSLRRWFQIRGYPTASDLYIWPSLGGHFGKKGEPLTTKAVGQMFERVAMNLGLRPKERGKQWQRYGASVKELRDLSLSLAQRAEGRTTGTSDPFSYRSAEYFAGHEIDELHYRKLHGMDIEYRQTQYRIVEPYVSPISGVTLDHEKTKELEAKNKELEARLERLEAISVERLVLAGKPRKHRTARN